MRTEFTAVIGVDVAKAKLDIAFSDEKVSIKNTKQDILTELIGRIDSK